MNIFRKIFLTLTIALVVLCYAYPMFVLPFGSYTYKKDDLQGTATFKIDGSYSIKLGDSETTGFYKVKNGKIYIGDEKDVDTSDDGSAIATVNNFYSITILNAKLENPIGKYSMLGIGVVSLLLVLSIPDRKRD